MFLRFVFYCILAYFAWRFVRWLMSPSPARSKRPTFSRHPAQMVRCESCGMFITEGSAMVVEGHDFCSRTCLEERARRR